MRVKIPDSLRQELRDQLWALGDTLGWQNLTWVEQTPTYEIWTRDPAIGGRLSPYMDERQIRLYLKDTIMKPYVRTRQAPPARPFKALGIANSAQISEVFERPHGRRLADGRVIAWGNAKGWKVVLTAVHERSYGVRGAKPYGVVLFSALGKFHETSTRAMVEDASRKLTIEHLVWFP